MSINKRKPRSAMQVFINPRTILALFIIFAIWLIIEGFTVLSNNKNLAERGIIGQGVVVDVMDVSTNETPYYHPLLLYTGNDGQIYEEYLPKSVKANCIGDTLSFLYLEESPGEIYNTEVSIYTDSILMWSFGSALILIVFLVWKLMTRGGPTRLKRSYTVDVVATVTGVSLNNSYTMNGRNAYVISAVYPHPQTDEDVFVRSKDLWYDPQEYLPEHVNLKVHPYNRRKYWMDTSFLPKRSLFGRR